MNYVPTDYVVKGLRKVLEDFYAVLQSLGVNEKPVYLENVGDHYGVDYESKKLPIMGYIYGSEDLEVEQDEALLKFYVSGCSDTIGFFDELNKLLGSVLSISYQVVSIEGSYLLVHDEGDFFPEECTVTSDGGNFKEQWAKLYLHVSDAIQEWCEATGIPQGNRTDEEMVDFINAYKYPSEDTYFSICLAKTV